MKIQKYKMLAGFTLVELLVVIGIIAVLISLLLPALSKARQQALSVSCVSNMRQLASACLLYANDSKGSYPPSITGYYQSVNSPFGAYGGSEDFRNIWDHLLSYGIRTNASRSCPASPNLSQLPVDQTLNDTQAAAWTYNYNAVIGGSWYSSSSSPYYSYTAGTMNGGTVYFARPLKVGQVKQSSLVGLFFDHADIQSGWSTGFVGPASSAGVDPQTLSDTQIMHFPKNLGGTYSTPWGNRLIQAGSNSVGFADGHAEVVVIKLKTQYLPWPLTGGDYLRIDPRY